MADCLLNIRVTPRSSQNKISVVDGVVKVWVTAAPTDGQANGAVVKVLAKALGLAPTFITIVRGDTGRDKSIRVEGLDLEATLARLA